IYDDERLPVGLLESELFGHEKGAFTGATHVKQGKFEFADGGSLFLDEVGDMALNLQVKLLRVLQEQEFQRIGGNRDIKVDVRIIAATNKDLKSEVEAGSFREDLYFRLNVVHIQAPPLRERKEDIPLLIASFVEKIAARLNRPAVGVDPDVINALYNYSWPGNVRELENVIERALVLCRGDTIVLQDMPPEVTGSNGLQQGLGTLISMDQGLPETLEAIEEEMIREALKKAGKVQARAAKMLGISRSNLQYKMKKYGLLQ
ncbi:sigma-54 interaction domain-containing protein, partial [Thermodesulfobacteriota bacterium]